MSNCSLPTGDEVTPETAGESAAPTEEIIV